MRISTSEVFDASALTRNQVDMMKTQAQISSGRKINSASDDPVGASQALKLRQTSSLTSQYQANQQSALNTLGQAESMLGNITTLLQEVRTAVVGAGDGTLNDSDRRSIGQAVQGQMDQLLSYANAADAAGGYLFAGYRDGSQPFVKGTSSVTYAGDQGGRTLQVSEARAVEISSNGTNIFQRIPAATGSYAATAGAWNSGSGSVGLVQVKDSTALQADHSYRVQFSVANGQTTYTVSDITAGIPGTNVAGQIAVPYTSGTAIKVAGLQFSVSGQPNDTDAFDIKPAATQSVFDTLQKLANLLTTPVTNAADRSTLASELGVALQNIDNAHEQALSVRSGMGSRMQEITSLQSVMGSRDIATKSALSQVEDLDYAAAISTLSQQQLVLQAAQKTYASVTKLSLFEFL